MPTDELAYILCEKVVKSPTSRAGLWISFWSQLANVHRPFRTIQMLSGIRSSFGEGTVRAYVRCRAHGLGLTAGEPIEAGESELFQILRSPPDTGRVADRTRMKCGFSSPGKELARSPEFFRHAPIVVDAGPVAGQLPPNLAEFARRLRQQQLVPVGLQNADETWSEMAVQAGLALFPPGRPVELAPSGSNRRARRSIGAAPQRDRGSA